MAALRAGVAVLKYFPARELGGAAMLKALAGPFPNVRFIPTGGIDPHNLSDYWRLSNVLAVGRGWLAPATLVAEGRFDEITHLAQEGRRSAKSIHAAEEVAR
jgi:2-dehydro-3-deoxyphosphogluconate aldolase/(4S)-4-hydroxy-2-oxoglutarate aldolase